MTAFGTGVSDTSQTDRKGMPTTGQPAKKAAKTTRVMTFVDVAKDLKRLEDRQASQRSELAVTDAEIAEKQKELRTLTDGIGRRK